jgi:hypothetical protein
MFSYQTLAIHENFVLTLDEVKKYLKISYDDEDAILQNCILSSIETAENFINIALRTKTISFSSDLGLNAKILVPLLPMLALEQVSLPEKDITDKCCIDQEMLGFEIVNLSSYVNKKCRVIYKAGFKDATKIPGAIKQGILCHIAEMYDKQIVNNSFMNEILACYKPFRKILI